MHRTLAAALASTALALPLAAQDQGQGAAAGAARALEAAVELADGTSAGTVTFTETPHGVLIEARLENLPEGPHGFHIHETGACAPDFQAAGGHYTPADTEHGYRNESGYHAGDLPNIHVQADGTATADIFAPWLTLAESPKADAPYPLDDGDGSAIMVHADADDYMAEPPGSTGDRIACGVIFPSEV
ncbi:superoxide dismutase family protein [Rhodovulum sp. 12E13]|uniref:superoxide dismutase family protein n=1 Tax=Rhodovulum sp. 12E13 TaxID=2203891 RepID=UPI000E14FC87|nr:superoxide dismutase family protein [Rhodovulum sp. 12E13]RDC70974.1 superoxide dismutase family protein [Rhodovulum sp. 12E13]